jgi:RNA polymerase sigma-70 factor (ECF subfamily)
LGRNAGETTTKGDQFGEDMSATLTGEEFVELLEAHKDEFFRYVYRNVWNASVAEDVFSSAVMAAWKQVVKFQKGSNFRAWMFRILTNKCYVANRETKRSSIDVASIDEARFAQDSAEDMHAAYADPDAFLDGCGDEVQNAIRQLSTAQRSCLLLLTVNKASYKDIAEILDMPVGTVMTHLARGRARLRSILARHAVDAGIIDSGNRYAPKKKPIAEVG